MSTVVAYKFLRPGAIGPFSGLPWPTPTEGAPGDWVEASMSSGICRDGVHACERAHLPRWLWEELWEVELGGEVEQGRHKLRAPRCRLLQRVETWSTASAGSFARACADHAAAHASAAPPDRASLASAMAIDCYEEAREAEAAADSYAAVRGAAVSSYIAAMTALSAGGLDRHESERDQQAEWLSRELGLD